MPAKLTSRQDRLCRAVRSRTSRSVRRSRRTASGRPADKCRGIMARLVVAPADQWHMPSHHDRIIGRRHHTHAADRQICGQPLLLCRAKRAVMQRSRRPARSNSPTSVRVMMTCCWVAYICAIWRSVVIADYLCGRNLRAGIFQGNAVGDVDDGDGECKGDGKAHLRRGCLPR